MGEVLGGLLALGDVARCLLLDYCSAGTGGPDFQLGEDQLAWLKTELDTAKADHETPVLFIHGYPADLRAEGEAERLTSQIADGGVALVEMGHTHYNEPGSDGATFYAATRSTGQIDEGPVGYSVSTLDRGVVSWRFRPLDDPFPFVMITHPADHRLLRGEAQRLGEGGELAGRVFGREAVDRVQYQVEDGEWLPTTRVGDGPNWRARLDACTGRLVELSVRAFTTSGRPGIHMIRVAGPDHVSVERQARGSDALAIGAWPENGIFGTQLGPNRNGRKW